MYISRDNHNNLLVIVTTPIEPGQLNYLIDEAKNDGCGNIRFVIREEELNIISFLLMKGDTHFIISDGGFNINPDGGDNIIPVILKKGNFGLVDLLLSKQNPAESSIDSSFPILTGIKERNGTWSGFD